MSLKHSVSIVAMAVFVAGISSAVVTKAQAQWYISGNVGAAILSDGETTDSFTAASVSGDLEFDTAIGITGAVGYSMGAFRLEGEISYRKNDLDTWGITSVVAGGTTLFSGAAIPVAAEGDVSSLGFMANVWYDFNTGSGSKWVPFIGGGAGVSKTSIDITSIAGLATTYDQTDTAFAYQVGAGIGYNVTPKVTVSLAYRLFGTSDPEFDDGTDKVDSEYLSHNILAGVIVKF